MKKYTVALLVGLMAMTQSAFAGAFPDVDENASSYTAIEWMADQGIVQGYGDGDFLPYQYVSRAEFLKMLYLSMGASGKEYYPQAKFSDMPDFGWFVEYVNWASAQGIVDGYPDGTFRPDDQINIVEAAKIVENAFFDIEDDFDQAYNPCYMNLTAPENYFSADTNAWYWKYLHVIDNLCVLAPGDSFGSFGFMASTNVRRQEMADMLYRAKAVRDNFENGEYPRFAVSIYEPDSILESYEYSPLTVKVGDVVGAMTADIVGGWYGGTLTGYSSEVHFKGPVTVTGIYNYHDEDDPFLNGSVCMSDLEIESSLRIPKIAYSPRDNALFCFSNEDFAKSEMGGNKGDYGRATVVIDNYESVYVEAEAWDVAELIEVKHIDNMTEDARTDLYLGRIQGANRDDYMVRDLPGDFVFVGHQVPTEFAYNGPENYSVNAFVNSVMNW